MSARLTSRSDTARFEKLYELFARLAACNDLDSALQEVLDAAIDVTGADAGYIRFFDPDEAEPPSSSWPFAAYKGISDEYVNYFGSLSEPVSPARRLALFEGRRTYIGDMTTDPIFDLHREIVVAEGHRTMHGTPLMSRNVSRCVGVICTHFRDIRSPSAASLETLDLFAELAATSIDHHRQIAELARRERSWGAILGEQADVLRWTQERLSELEDTAPRLQPREVTQLAHSILSRLGQVESARPLEAGGVPDDQYADNPHGLSPSELEVLINVWRGLSDKETAVQMGVSRFTVAKHLGSAMRKLNVETRYEASILVGRDIVLSEGGSNLSFGELLWRFRRRAGQTQLELAEKAGLSHRTISDLERGVRTKVYATTVNLISTALALDQDDATTLAASVDRSRKPRLDSAHLSLMSPT